MPMLGEDCSNNIVGVNLNFKWLLQVWQCEYWCKEEVVLHLNERLLSGLELGKLFFHITLSNMAQRPSDMGESQHEPLIKI